MAALSRALDVSSGDDRSGLEESLEVDPEAVIGKADRLAARGKFSRAREILLEETELYTRWIRAIDFGVARIGLSGDSDADVGAETEQASLALRAVLARLATRAALYGSAAGLSPAQVAHEVVAAEGFKLDTGARFAASGELARCYQILGRPELALTALLRCSPEGFEAAHLQAVLIAGRCMYAEGQTQLLAELVGLEWQCDSTGLQKELLRRLLVAQEPDDHALIARGAARQEAMSRGDWATLRELALFDVMWLEESKGLWLALSAILKMNGAAEQAALAEQAAQLAGAQAGRRRR